ncbi:SpoIIE family protein phosphatase [Rhodoflexus caldus]|uniref:SpoIIE family protein phosphatase n=1 Tax=Rhodoflexus caldus TaxID=2891236 RepID=UPI00202AA172|nr:SpoIIE family protein phosphatase [Rhodoflexus caldus]
MPKLLLHIITALAVLLPLHVSAQAPRRFDSLIKVLQTREQEKAIDTLYTKTLFRLADLMLYNHTDTAIFFAQKGLKLAQAQGWKRGEADLALILGQGYDIQGKAPQAVEQLLTSIKAFETLKDSLGLSDAYNAIGIVYGRNLRQPHEALNYYRKALEIAERLSKGQEESRILYILSNIGIEEKRIGQLEKALQTQMRALSLAKKFNDPYSLGSIYHNIGSIYIAMKDAAKALEYLTLSNRIAAEKNNPYLAAANNNSLGKVKLMLGDLPGAIGAAETAMTAGQQMGAMDYMRESSETLYEAYKALRQPEKALFYHEQFTRLKDSLVNQENTKQVERLQAQIEIDKKQQAILLLEKDNANKQLQLIASIAIAALLLAAGAILIWAYRVKQRDNRLLQKQKAEIREKNEELNQANEELSSALETVEQQKRNIQAINEELTASMHYARHIQQALLPSEKQLKQALPEHFIFYRPRDIVSGDFYWLHHTESTTILAVADCTGHGVPGALLSMVGTALLRQIVAEKQVYRPEQILSELHAGIYQALRHNADMMSQDGMDISIITIEKANGSTTVHYAGAMNPVYCISNQAFYEFRPTKKAIGGSSEAITFYHDRLVLQHPAMLYLFSDGYQDQFGGADSKKFMVRRFKETLRSLSVLPVETQAQHLIEIFDNWKQNQAQVDDVLVVGVRLQP